MIQIETILDILVKGFVIGIVVSAPLGPVGVLLYSAYFEQRALVWICHRTGGLR